jgi:hypothetical protein
MARLTACLSGLLLLATCLTAWQQASAQSLYQSSFSRLSCGDFLTRVAGKTVTIRPENFCQSFGLER